MQHRVLSHRRGHGSRDRGLPSVGRGLLRGELGVHIVSDGVVAQLSSDLTAMRAAVKKSPAQVRRRSKDLRLMSMSSAGAGVAWVRMFRSRSQRRRRDSGGSLPRQEDPPFDDSRHRERAKHDGRVIVDAISTRLCRLRSCSANGWPSWCPRHRRDDLHDDCPIPAGGGGVVPCSTRTGQMACSVHAALTEPSSRPLKPPCPRLPTTSIRALSLTSSRTCAG